MAGRRLKSEETDEKAAKGRRRTVLSPLLAKDAELLRAEDGPPLLLALLDGVPGRTHGRRLSAFKQTAQLTQTTKSRDLQTEFMGGFWGRSKLQEQQKDGILCEAHTAPKLQELVNGTGKAGEGVAPRGKVVLCGVRGGAVRRHG